MPKEIWSCPNGCTPGDYRDGCPSHGSGVPIVGARCMWLARPSGRTATLLGTPPPFTPEELEALVQELRDIGSRPVEIDESLRLPIHASPETIELLRKPKIGPSALGCFPIF